jgi:hypothetical protein
MRRTSSLSVDCATRRSSSGCGLLRSRTLWSSATGAGRSTRRSSDAPLSQCQLFGRRSESLGLDVGQERRRHLRPLPAKQVTDRQELHHRIGLLVDRPSERPRMPSRIHHAPGRSFQRDDSDAVTGGSPWYSRTILSYTLRVAQLRGQMRFEPLAGFGPATSTIRRVRSIH